jgi:tRNA G46 methylase TrmB
MTHVITPLRKLNSRDLDWPANWTALFSVDRPLVLEIGFGYGTLQSLPVQS